jgi:subtilisin family serine protease
LASQEGRLEEAIRRTGLQDIQFDGTRVLVSIIPEPGRMDAAAGAVTSVGGRVKARANGFDYIEAYVPVSALPALVQHGAVHHAGVTALLMPAMVTTEGFTPLNVQPWHQANPNLTGAGVKVGIIDAGFAGFSGLPADDRPATFNTTCSQSTWDQGGNHGTAVAEIIYDLAPGAELYLARANSAAEVSAAESCLASQSVSIINMSAGWIYNVDVGGPGDGTGYANSIVDTSTSRTPGIFWVQSAGNLAKAHWRGPWADADGDGRLEFSGSDELQDVYISAGSTINVSIRWDDPWPYACNDFVVQLWADESLSGDPVKSSSGTQNCLSGSYPVEGFSYQAAQGGTYYIQVFRLGGSGTPTVELMTYSHELQHQTASHSLWHPADNSSNGMVTIGAVPWCNDTVVEPFSSQGPTSDNRTKPDIVAPDWVTTATYGSSQNCTNQGAFWGTSAAAPHVAGAAALVKQLNPSWTPSQIKSYLQAKAVDRGAAGPDNVFGSGRIYLPANAPTVTQLTPAVGGPGTTVTIDGANFPD